jgi:thiol-disulfide isomerase/thioredoxin
VTGSPSPAPKTALTRVVLALAIVLVAGTTGFLAYRLGAQHGTTLAPAPLTANPQQAQPEEPPAPAPRAIPESVPKITMTDAAGTPRKLTEWKGHPTLINFWATWCEPCRREIPLLQKLRGQYAADGLEVVGIAVDSRDAVLQYAREMHIDYPVLIGEQDGLDAVAAFGMETVFPFTVFTDRQARIVTLKVGELHPDEAAFILSRVRDVDAGRLALPVARQEIAAQIPELAAQRARRSTAD